MNINDSLSITAFQLVHNNGKAEALRIAQTNMELNPEEENINEHLKWRNIIDLIIKNNY